MSTLETRLESMQEGAATRDAERDTHLNQTLAEQKEDYRLGFEGLSEQLGAVTQKVNSESEMVGGKFGKVEENFGALQAALRDIQADNNDKLGRMVEETRKGKEIMSWLEGRVKDSKVEYTGKIHEIAHVAREQRRQVSGDRDRIFSTQGAHGDDEPYAG